MSRGVKSSNNSNIRYSLPEDDSVLEEMELEGFLTDTPAHYYRNNTGSSSSIKNAANRSGTATSTSTNFRTKQWKRRRRRTLVFGVLVLIGITILCFVKFDFSVSTVVQNENLEIEDTQSKQPTNGGITPSNEEEEETKNINSTTELSIEDNTTNIIEESATTSDTTTTPTTTTNKEHETTIPDISPTMEEEEEETVPQQPDTTNTTTIPTPTDKWGYWKFYDGNEQRRPKEDYCSRFPSKDIKAQDLPFNSWQADAVYVNHFLDEAKKLVHRAKEAILEEYGFGQPRTTEQSIEAQKMFRISMISNITSTGGPPVESKDQGGWTTKRSFTSLARRLLHAMITKDTFTVVMGGDSTAAGHGNHFNQSYMMQFHHVMEPVLEHLGMKLITRNMAQEYGTLQSALAAQSIYGDELDMILWDMKENQRWEFDLFCRQVLLGSNRAPFLLLGSAGGDENFEVLQMLHENVGADVGGLGSGMSGIPITLNEDHAKTLPWATQYVKCAPDSTDLCVQNKFRTQCWVDRDDVTPPTEQKKSLPVQQAQPGFRQHQLKGRVLAFFILQALDQAISKWSEKTVIEGMPLADEYWHMSEYYGNIQQKAKEMPPRYCEEWVSEERFPVRICKVSLKGRTEYTPRANPDNTSITSILQLSPDGYLPSVEPPLYEGDDVPNPAATLPEGAFNVRSILDKRRNVRNLHYLKQKNLNITSSSAKTLATKEANAIKTTAKDAMNSIIPGRGWMVHSEPSGYCDGSAESRCGRQASSECLLSGHNDGSGGVQGDGLSGWLVMSLDDVKEGIIMMSVDFLHSKNIRTANWTEVNDGKRNLKKGLNSSKVESKGEEVSQFSQHKSKNIPNNTVFEYAINGKITSLNNAQLIDRTRHVKRHVKWTLLLDDEEISKAGKSLTVELAIRLVGCGRECNISINYVYWA